MDDALRSPLDGVTLKTIQANGITMRYAEAGTGPLALFCHGWPESWYSWRHLIKAVSAAGFRAVAPDMRGFGGTDAPQAIDKYTQFHMIGDMVELVKQLGETRAVIIGHDWGAPIAWGSAMLRPDIFRAVVGMSVPFTPPGYVDLLTALEKMGITTFYIQYFQHPGVAEAEFERDVRATLHRLYAGRRREGQAFGLLRPGGGMLENLVEPPGLPDWLSEADLAYYVAQFERTGFRGGLNWYRNITRSWELTGPWRGQIIRHPALFIAGSRDGVISSPVAQAQIEAFPKTLPGLRGKHILDGAGHWVQQERGPEVSRLVVEFLKGL
jgi:pimeloyl-ACP methyl ester carboxylesterase